jgi:1-acyl-sn-glycerol-3-phosphate acyltransferase
MDDILTLLTRANAREVLAAFKLDRLGCFQPLADWLASFPARRLSRHLVRFDDLVGQHGLAAAGRYILDEFTGSTRVEGQRHVPPCGPVLAVANHPGMVDAMAIWVALERRRDLKIIAAEREILQLIPNVRSRLLFVSPRTGSRSGLLRDATNHLRRGGALLTFPAGTIEPDPSVRVVDALAGWSDSSELFVRLVPETLVLPIAVCGVISRTAHRHRIAKCFADPKEREWAAATLQVLCRHLRDTQTRVVIGEPIPSGQFNQRAAIHAAMASLLARVNNHHDDVATSDEARHGIAHTATRCHNSIQLGQSCARVL